MHFAVISLPLAPLFFLILQALDPQGSRRLAIAAGTLAFGFGAAFVVLDTVGAHWPRASGWITLAAGMCLAGAGLLATGTFGPRRLRQPWVALVLGFCAAFGAAPIPNGVAMALGTLATLALALVIYFARLSFSKHPVDGILLLIAGALVANGSYAGLGFWLIEWFS
jgi:hypothetical protein